MNKSSVEEIKNRFDNDVARFSNLQMGQSSTIDAPLVLELITEAAAHTTPQANTLLDVGCGAGNYSLKMLERLPDLAFILVDLSRPMLDRAAERLSDAGAQAIEAKQGDIREIEIAPQSVDLILAGAVLHHLRSPEEWKAVAQKFYDGLRVGGSLWISDLTFHEIEGVTKTIWPRYGRYLTDLKDEAYRDHVFDYIEKEDSPVSVTFQINILQSAGFSKIDVLHKNGPFAALGAVK